MAEAGMSVVFPHTHPNLLAFLWSWRLPLGISLSCLWQSSVSSSSIELSLSLLFVQPWLDEYMHTK